MYREGRSWRQLANFLGRLPPESQYVTAQRNDPDVAQYLAENPLEDKQWAPSPPQWDLTRELLAALFDRIGDLITVTVNTSGKSGQRTSPPPPFPRPVTEIDKVRARVEAQVEEELTDLIARAQENWAREQEQLNRGG